MGIIDSIELPRRANVREMLERAGAHFEQSRLDAAESLCREILERDSGNIGALKYLGLIAYKTGHAAAAAKILGRAVGLDGANAELLFHFGGAQFANGEPALAADSYRRAIQVSPAFLPQW